MSKVENILNDLFDQTPITRGELNEVLKQIDKKFDLVAAALQKLNNNNTQ
jgi:hypothetical protein